MSEAITAPPKASPARPAPNATAATGRVAELKVSGHLMTLDTGLFCVFQVPGLRRATHRSGFPGSRVWLPPGPVGRPDAISISTFREDGWMNGGDSAALVRVS